MTPKEACQAVIEEFPFDDYINPAAGGHLSVAKTVLRYLEPGSKILDFGAGTCGKAAMLSKLGFKCIAYDDLQDAWYKDPGNTEKILSFAKDCGVDFKVISADTLPSENESFDMLMMHDVLEHLHNSPRNLLNDLLERVKPEGLFFATVPSAVNIRKRLRVLFGKTNLHGFEEYYWYPDPWRGHVREYVKDDLAKLSEYLSLDILELRPCDHMLTRIPVGFRWVYKIVTGVIKGWKDSWLLVARKKPDWSPRKDREQD